MEGDAAHIRVKRARLAMLNNGSLTFERPLFDQPVQISVEKIEWQEYSVFGYYEFTISFNVYKKRSWKLYWVDNYNG